jgi:hypothetical protein
MVWRPAFLPSLLVWIHPPVVALSLYLTSFLPLVAFALPSLVDPFIALPPSGSFIFPPLVVAPIPCPLYIYILFPLVVGGMTRRILLIFPYSLPLDGLVF